MPILDAPVLTGHADGVITVNIAEADDAERERRRTAMREPYRTLLGHMRHESGHYYWDRLIAGTRTSTIPPLFGDERADYAAALSTYYERGAPADWQERFVSAYATRTPGRIGPKRGRTISTWSTRSRPPPHAASR